MKRDARKAARRRIVEAATKFSRERTVSLPRLDGFVFLPAPYAARHIQRAVFVCRQRQLVDADTLRTAGFNA